MKATTCPKCSAGLEMTQSTYFNLDADGTPEIAFDGVGDWRLSCNNDHELASTSGCEDFIDASSAAAYLLGLITQPTDSGQATKGGD